MGNQVSEQLTKKDATRASGWSSYNRPLEGHRMHMRLRPRAQPATTIAQGVGNTPALKGYIRQGRV